MSRRGVLLQPFTGTLTLLLPAFEKIRIGMDNIVEKYDRFVQHLHDSAKGIETLKTTKRRLPLKTLDLLTWSATSVRQ